MTVCLPIFKVKADYIVRQGRSWSPLEHLVLWKLAQGRATSLELAEQSAVPMRLIVECLVELMSAGWVDVHTGGSEVYFEATPSGRKAAGSERLPEDTRSRKRSTTLCVDRVGMAFFEPEDLTLVHSDQLPKNAYVIKPRVYKLSMSPAGSLDRLYMLEDETFEEWVDYRITSQRFYAVLTVVGRRIEGLPIYAPPELHEAVLEDVASEAEEEDAAFSGQELPSSVLPMRTRDGYTSCDVGVDDLFLGGPEHLDLVRGVFDRAKSFVVLHTCFVHPAAVRKLLPLLESAARRKVQIDLLWGQRTAELQDWSREAFLEAKNIFEGLPPSLRSKVRFAEKETGSHAKVILADSGARGSLEAYVGSCNWLSAQYTAIEFSVRLRDPWTISSVATALAELRMPASGRWTPDIYRLASIRTVCRKIKRRDDGSHQIALVLDREHLAAVREARDTATSNIVAGCDLLGPAGETSVFVPARAASTSGVPVTLIYNTLARSLEETTRDRAIAELESAGVALLRCEKLHGKFLYWDDDALIVSSFNWLATTPDPWKPRGAEIGVIIKGPGLVSEVRRRFSELCGLLSG